MNQDGVSPLFPTSNSVLTKMDLKQLNDIHEIRDLLDRYGSTVDEKDWAGFAQLFTDPLETDFSGIDPMFQPATLTVEQQVASTSVVIGQFTTTQHMITNAQVQLNGDTATCRATMRAEHWYVVLCCDFSSRKLTHSVCS